MNILESILKPLISKRVSADIESVFLTGHVQQLLLKYAGTKEADDLRDELEIASFDFLNSFNAYRKGTAVSIAIMILSGSLSPNELTRQHVISVRTKCVAWLKTKGEVFE